MKLSANGIAALEFSEGLKLIAYPCSAKVWTIGLGTTVYPDGSKVRKGDRITKAQAYEYLRHDLTKFETQVNRLVQVPLTQNQFDALVLLTYNIGGGGLQQSTVLKKLNNRDYKGAAKAFMLWNKTTDLKTKKKVFSQGLHDRRKREMELFLRKDNPNTGEISVYHEADPNNTPLRNRDLPLPTAYQEHGIDSVVEDNNSTKKNAAIAGVGTAGVGSIATIAADPQIITQVLNFAQALDYRVLLAMVAVGTIGWGIWWIWGRK